MNLLYISEDYMASKVHHQLLNRFADRGIDVTVFSVARLSDSVNDIRSTYSPLNYKVISFTLSRLKEIPYRYIFGFKRRLKYSYLLSHIDAENIDFVHASTVFSEGVVAYMLHKQFAIPYSVSVRATDLQLYLSKMPHLWRLGLNILKNAAKIVFISPVIKNKFFDNKVVKPILDDIAHKCIIIPNGIDDFWIDNSRKKPAVSLPSQILYIGRFDRNKNVEALIKAVLALKQEFHDLHLYLVGGGDVCHNKIIDYCDKFNDAITYHGKEFDKDKLLNIMRNSHIFAMVSHSETFGLVYLEALSQGLPILYTAGQGIDLCVPAEVGEKADSYDLLDIMDKLRKIITNYNLYKQIDISHFSWDNVASDYIDVFKSNSVNARVTDL